jgi:hypothetical protein
MAGYWLEIWRRPGAFDFGKVFDTPLIRDGSYHVGIGLVGAGTMNLPDTFRDFDDILDVVNEVGSLVRIREDVTGSIVGEWIPNAITPVADKDDPFVAVSGNGMNEVLGYAVVEAYDWDGLDAWTPVVPDWIWGGENVLTNGDFENPSIAAKVMEIVVTGTGGTYIISAGGDDTDPIAYNAGGPAIEAEIEAEIAAAPDVVCFDVGSSPLTRTLVMVTPPFGVVFALNDAGVTGGDATILTTEEGGMTSPGWTVAKPIANPGTGFYDYFSPTDQENHTPGGTYSHGIDPGVMGPNTNRSLGIQQVVTVIPGQLYQASIWVFPTSSTDRYRLAIFTPGEEFIAYSDLDGTSFSAGSWHQITITDVLIPPGVTEVIFRFQNTNPFPYNPAVFYVDDAEFNEGMVPTTVGEIIRVMYEDACVDHVGDGRIVWEDDANPGNPYLLLDFDDVNDSAGDPWENSAVSIRLFMRMTYLMMMEALESQEGIEWRVVPQDPLAGSSGIWLLQVYNEGGMDDAPAVTIHGGSQDTRRELRRFRPSTAWLVEGANRVSARAETVSGFGRLESARMDRTAPDMNATVREANQDKANATAIFDVWSYELTNPQDAPLYQYRIGDTLGVHDPPDVVNESGRLWELNMLVGQNAVTWDVDILKPEIES